MYIESEEPVELVKLEIHTHFSKKNKIKKLAGDLV